MSTESPVSPSVSRRATTLASVPSQQRINTFLRDSVYAMRQHVPGICDLALGNPHQMPQAAYVEALADALTPRNEGWFAYKTNEPEAQAAAAAYRLVEPRVGAALAACPSGRELSGWGYASDVTIAAELDASQAVPTLRDGWLEPQ